MSYIGRWYEAVGGAGLEVKHTGGEWHCVGYIQQRGKRFHIRVNPYQDEGYTLATHNTLADAKADFLDRMGVTEVIEGKKEES